MSGLGVPSRPYTASAPARHAFFGLREIGISALLVLAVTLLVLTGPFGGSSAFAASPHEGGVERETCSTCHVPHKAATARGILKSADGERGQAALCLLCHDGSGASTNMHSGPDSFGLSSGHRLEDEPGVTDEVDLTNACSGCHWPHGDPAVRPALLAPTVNSVPVPAGGNDLCLACHNDEQDWYAATGTYPGLDDPSRDASGYPVAGTFPGATTYRDPVANAHVGIPASNEPTRSAGDCLLCHNAHGSASRYDSLVATLAPSTAASLAHDRATGEYAALCLGCHDGGSWEASGAVDIKRYVTAGASDDSTRAAFGHRIKTAGGTLPVGAAIPCYDCHNPHGSSRGNASLISDERGAGLDTRSGAADVRRFCLGCHATSDLKGWDSVAEAYTAVTALDTFEGLRRDGGPAGSGPEGGYNWLRLAPSNGHQSADTESCYVCHGDEYGSPDSNNVHSPRSYDASQHTPGGPCVTSGCHPTDAEAIHEAGPKCSACHAQGTTPSLACRSCHEGDQHPGANHTNTSMCYGCHAESNLMAVHGDDCSKCHPTPAAGMTYAGGCSQTGCHSTLHPDPWTNATYQPGHSQVGWGHSDWGSDCWECHEMNAWEGTSCTTPYCHPHAYEKVAPTTVSNAAGSYVGAAAITLTATDAGEYWGGSDAQWFISGVKTTYYQLDGGPLQTGISIVVAPPSRGSANHTLEFWSLDNNYNVEQHRFASFVISAAASADTDPPTGTMSVNSGAAYTTSAAVTVGSSVTDADSGVSFLRVDPGSGAFGAWTAYAASLPVSLAAGNGTNTVRVQYMDGGGNVLTLTDTIVLDSSAPTGTMVVNGGAGSTAITAVTLDSSMADPHSGVAQMRFSNDNVSWSAWEAYAATKSWTLSSGNALKTVYAQYRDAAGNQTATISDTITYFDGNDPTPPTGSLIVNSFAAYTTNPVVTLTLSATDTGGSGLSQMCFSNDGTNWSAWEAYATSRSWTLSAGNGGKTVYAKYRDGSLNESPVYSRSIILDAAMPTGSMLINGGAASTTTSIVTLNSSVTDTGGSGLSQMRFSNDGTNWSAWQTYAATKVWTLSSGNGVKTVYAQYRDNAGNVSLTYTDTITMTATTATLSFVWHPGLYGEAHLRVEDALGNEVMDQWVSGYGTDLDLSIAVPAGQLYYMEVLYYYDEDWDESGGPYGKWTNDPTLNPDGVLSPGEVLIWYY